MGGKLYPEGLGNRGPWRSEGLVYYPEEALRLLSAPHPAVPIVTDPEELRQIVRASTLPAVKLWIHEVLENAVCQLWEGQQRE